MTDVGNERIPTCQQQVYFWVTKKRVRDGERERKSEKECVVLAKKITSAFVKQGAFLRTFRLK